MNDSLQAAFGEAYLDLCREGLCLYDQQILEELWAEFIRDMKSGFSSCFDNEQELNGDKEGNRGRAGG